MSTPVVLVTSQPGEPATAEHDTWFRARIRRALAEADGPAAEWVSAEDAEAGWHALRAKLEERAKGSAA